MLSQMIKGGFNKVMVQFGYIYNQMSLVCTFL